MSAFVISWRTDLKEFLYFVLKETKEKGGS